MVSGRPNRRQTIGDIVLAAVCLAVVLVIHVFELDAVPENRTPDALSVAFTVAAIAPLALRRRAPLLVLISCFPGIWALALGQYPVGAAPVGPLIGFYTVVAWDSRRHARWAVATVVLGVAGLVALQPVDLRIEGIIANTAILVGGWIIGTGTRERREHAVAQAAAAELQLTLERERADLASDRAQLATTRERLRISRELHDVLGHAFSVMVVQAGAAERLLDSHPDQARLALQQVSATGRSSLADLRGMVQVLRAGDDAADDVGQPLMLAEEDVSPGLAEVPALVHRIREAGLAVELDLDEPAAPSHPGVELAAYRIVQGGLTNCLKHAQASRAWVRIRRAVGELEVEVRDDGTGSASAGTSSGHGLTGMRERVTIYGGELEAGPSPSGGYRVHARLPLPTGVIS
jgi:signal transduction histidine kinase